MTYWISQPLTLSALFLALLFFATWRLSVAKDNYGFVDVTWSLAFAPIALGYAVMFDGWEPRRWLAPLLITAWSLRLGLHLWSRVAAHHPEEDPRYAVLRERWSGPGLFLVFFLAQGLLVWLLLLPLAVIAGQAREGFHFLELAGAALWLGGVGGEALADRQLRHFKREHSHPEAVCNEGLWRYSRHPNYFFQSLLWWGLFLMALPFPWGWITILAPLAMLTFLLRVTGVPLTERLAVERKGQAYRDYQRTTSAFVPWPPRSNALSAPRETPTIHLK